MRKAYDTFLQSEVSADLAAVVGGPEPFRYECACCGEEVRLAAVSSINMVSHFRHRNGNNAIECENYLGQYGAISIDSRSRKSKNERAEFYFNKRSKQFFLGLRFSEEEINAYEQLSTSFELRMSAQEQAFTTLLINKRYFAPDTPLMIPIKRFSYKYFLSNTHNGVRRPYELFKNSRSNGPTFFKIQGNDTVDFIAKLVRSAILYTNVPYFAVFQGSYSTARDNRLPDDITVEDIFQFETMGKKFLGKCLTIKDKTVEIESLLLSWGYRLEASETLTLLWPPASQVDGVTLVDTEHAYLYSSFELHAYGNVNVHSEDIRRVANGVSKVALKPKTIVYSNKNAEIIIDKRQQYSAGFDNLQIVKKYESSYVTEDDHVHFLFNRSGVVSLSKGQSTQLTPGSVVKRYLFGYLDGCIYPKQQKVLTREQLLSDIFAHYRRIEAFSKETFDSFELSEIAFRYIERCEKSGFINSAAKRFIMEGLV